MPSSTRAHVSPVCGSRDLGSWRAARARAETGEAAPEVPPGRRFMLPALSESVTLKSKIEAFVGYQRRGRGFRRPLPTQKIQRMLCSTPRQTVLSASSARANASMPSRATTTAAGPPTQASMTDTMSQIPGTNSPQSQAHDQTERLNHGVCTCTRMIRDLT